MHPSPQSLPPALIAPGQAPVVPPGSTGPPGSSGPPGSPGGRGPGSRRRTLSVLVAGGVVGLALPMVPVASPSLAPAAVASSTYHCSDYDRCRKAGYTDYGYGAVNRTMYWRMYGGHNCTNYVAYRMIKNGMSKERPWSGSGMARNWGLAMSRITDKTPAVGAVAWWAAGDGVGSSGHVAVVEKVVSSTEIVISEDSWSGTFHWRTIRKDGSSWPTGFIHFVDKKSIDNTAAPSIGGAPRVGAELTASPGRWKPGGDYRYQWLAEGTPIRGATAASYTPTAAEAGKTLRVQVTAARSGYTPGSAVSAPTEPVAAGALQSNGAPTLDGVGQVGEVLTATSAGWTPTPSMTAFRWRANGRIIPKQSGATLTLTRDHLGKRITVTEIARATGFAKGDAPASAAVGPVVDGVITTPQRFRAAGQAKMGTSLRINPGKVAPADTRVSYEWLRDGEVVRGATEATYRLTAADVGHHIVARVVMSKANHKTLRRTFVMGDKVTTTSVLAANANGKKRAAAVGIRLHAPGMGRIDGPVTVRVGNKKATGQVRNGFVRVLVPNVKPGQRKVRVTFAGTDVVEASAAATTVTIAR